MVKTGVSAVAVSVALIAAVALRVAATPQPSIVVGQSQAEMERKNTGCVSCHKTDEPTMHPSGTVRLACVDCHGGNGEQVLAAGTPAGSEIYERVKRDAHPRPRYPELWRSSANPVRVYTDWLRESQEYIQFLNPGDLRVVDRTCGVCHAAEARHVRTSMMTHGAMLWGAALYNNGGFPLKNPQFGESYAPDGTPQRLQSWPPPTPEETRAKGVLPFLDPLPRWEITQPGNVLRAFERGGRKRAEVGNPPRDEDPGRPDFKLSDRGFGTLLRTDPVFLGLQKTRLLDPLLSFPGTNDQPGDYRGSGCTACHVVYANDRSKVHAAGYAIHGNTGLTATVDATIPRDEPGHPIRHTFTRSIPSSQCMVCHMHPGTNMVTTYYGFTWWENETDGEAMYPKEPLDLSDGEKWQIRMRNPEGSAVRGLWADPDFLKQLGTPEFNRKLRHTQFADFHSHGWIFRAVFKRDRKGNLLDDGDRPIPAASGADLQAALGTPTPEERASGRPGRPVHLKDIHLEGGMQCIDCHFTQDNHGNGRLYGETRNAVEIDCVDCHGTIERRTTLRTSGPAAPRGGTPLEILRTPFGERRFVWRDQRLWQRSMLEPKREWEIVQVADAITPGRPNFNEQARLAKTIQRDNRTWGAAAPPSQLAHPNQAPGDGRPGMTCYACHTSWTPSCFGCHLSMQANERTPMLHNEGLMTRNWTAYNFQVLRDDAFMLGRDGTVTGQRIAPIRSACAVLVSSQNQFRDWIYYTQQTISAEGLSGQAFSPFVPHTVRSRETKRCADCHVSRTNDNNAWMANVLLQGTNFLNYIGRYAYVATGTKGFEAIVVAERDEPPAVIGSDLHKLAYPDRFRKHEAAHQALTEAHHHPAENALDIQVRGEYAYVALGKGGFRVYDIANVDNKDFSERIVTAPVSPFGQRLYVKTKNAVAVASPTTLGVDPLRTRRPENEEQPIHLMYGFLYVADTEEGLIVVGDPDLKGKSPGVGTLLDGNPSNNFLKRAVTFNPDGRLRGARRIAIAGAYAYVLCDRGLVVVDLANPLQPKISAEIGAPDLDQPRGVAVQFRYAFVVDRAGLKVLDVTALDRPRVVPGAFVPLEDARNVYPVRTYAYVAGGKQGLAIVDIERPEQPRLDQVFTADHHIDDTYDVKVGMTNASQFAYLADGHNGLHVVQLFSPADNPNHYGFSPRPTPKLIATFHTHGPALAVSEGIDRDRAVDEGGNQLAVFGRRGSRPFNRADLERMYLRDGQVYPVTNDPPGPPPPPPTAASMLRGLLPADLGTWLARIVRSAGL